MPRPNTQVLNVGKSSCLSSPHHQLGLDGIDATAIVSLLVGGHLPVGGTLLGTDQLCRSKLALRMWLLQKSAPFQAMQ